MNIAYLNTPVGCLKLEATDTHICSLHRVSSSLDEDTGNGKIPTETDAPLSPLLREAIRQLMEYFDGRRSVFDLPLRQEGTAFQQKVWEELMKIPYGEQISYGELARRVGNAKACRAVGSANGKNNICIIVPCHRVVQWDGSVGGYAYGPEMKRFLLDLEKRTGREGSLPD